MSEKVRDIIQDAIDLVNFEEISEKQREERMSQQQQERQEEEESNKKDNIDW